MVKIGAGFLVIFGLGVAGSGIFHYDPGCPLTGGSFINFVHYLVSIIGVGALVIAALLFWKGFEKDGRWRRYRSYSLITALVLLALIFAGVLFFTGRSTGFRSSWAGAFERLTIGVSDLWIELMAIKLLRLSNK